jgi:hypothetical protein
MQSQEPLPSQNWSVEPPIPCIFPARSWPGAVARLMVDERQFDQRALLRWADDGGRWANSTSLSLR